MSFGVPTSSESPKASARSTDQNSATIPRIHRKLSRQSNRKSSTDPTELHFSRPLARDVAGRAPLAVKETVLNALAVYGVGEKGFASAAGRAINVRSLDLENYEPQNENKRMDVLTAKAISEVVVNEGMF